MNTQTERWSKAEMVCEMTSKNENADGMIEGVGERLCKWKCTMSKPVFQESIDHVR